MIHNLLENCKTGRHLFVSFFSRVIPRNKRLEVYQSKVNLRGLPHSNCFCDIVILFCIDIQRFEGPECNKTLEVYLTLAYGRIALVVCSSFERCWL